MHVIVGFAQAVGTKLTAWLVAHGGPFVLAGTFALAGIGAAIMNPAPAGPDRATAQPSYTVGYDQTAHHCHHGADTNFGAYHVGY